MSDKELNDFEANVILRAALNKKAIDLSNDPLHPQLAEAIKEKKLTMGLFTAMGATINLMVFYSYAYKIRVPIYKVIGRVTTVTAFCMFFYFTSPGNRKYNQTLIDISRTKKKELRHVFDP